MPCLRLKADVHIFYKFRDARSACTARDYHQNLRLRQTLFLTNGTNQEYNLRLLEQNDSNQYLQYGRLIRHCADVQTNNYRERCAHHLCVKVLLDWVQSVPLLFFRAYLILFFCKFNIFISTLAIFLVFSHCK